MLTELSIAYSLGYSLAVFLPLYEYRCSKKVFIIATTISVSLMCGVTFWVIFRFGIRLAGQVGVFTCSIPSFILFFLLSKGRDLRFIFTFCLADTVSLWLMLTTGVIDFVAGQTKIVLFVLRLVLFPLLGYAVWRWFRKPYIHMLHTIDRGWGLCMAMTALIYIMITVIIQFPTLIWDRPEYLPHTILFIILMPLIYATLFAVLLSQQAAVEEREKNAALALKSLLAEENLKQVQKSSEALSKLRHDMLGQLTTLQVLGQAGQYDRLMSCLSEYTQAAESIKPVKITAHPVVNAILSYTLDRAERTEIKFTYQISIPEVLPIPDRDLSVFLMNLLDNALEAADRLPPERERWVKLVMKVKGRYLLINAENAALDSIGMDESGNIPRSQKGEGHGWGMKILREVANQYQNDLQIQTEPGMVSIGTAMLLPEA